MVRTWMLLGCLLGMGMFAHAEWPALRTRDPQRQAALRPRLERIRLTHPRIFYGAEDFAALRQRIENTREIQEVYAWLLEWARGKQYYRNLWATPNQLIAACVAYRLTEEPAILEHAQQIADYLTRAEGDSWTWPRLAKGLAFAYDWLYEALSPETRRRYGQAALHAAKQCYKTWRHSDFNNHVYLEYGPVLYPGIALWREGIDDEAAEQMALDGLELLVDHFMPAHEIVAQGDGGWYESMSYHAFFTYEFAHLLELWCSASGEDLWADYWGLDGEAAWQVYCQRPFDRGWVSVADIGKRDSFSTANAQYLVLLQRRRRDGLARYWVDALKAEAIRRHAAGVKYTREGANWWPYVLWYDPSVPLVQPAQLPPQRYFRGLGWVAMRSDWTKDATFALFVCNPLWLGGHQHADNNSFIIHKRGLLAIDSGVYEGTPHRANYYARTIAHNTVTIYDPAEQFNGGVWGAGRPGEGSNDGGQLFTPGPYLVGDLRPGDAYHRGDIPIYQAGPDFVYVVGDATRSYAPSKVREFTRAFLYLRPDLFIVFDRVESTRPEFTKTWLLHSPWEPERNGPSTSFSNGRARLRVWTLWPEDPRLETVGGPGREFEVEGRNYPPEKPYDPDEAGRWRLEVRPSQRAARQYFLHVILVEDLERPQAVDVRLRRSEGHLGVEVQGFRSGVQVDFPLRGPLNAVLRLDGRELALGQSP